MVTSVKTGQLGLLLEAEVAPRTQKRFENRYQKATNVTVTPGSTGHYQSQANKWGAELRMYFDDPALYIALLAAGLHVEKRQAGYLAGQFKFRCSNNKMWWELVEIHGLRLGVN